MANRSMSRERWARLEHLVDAALELEPHERARFAESACTDPGLREELKALLLACDQSDDAFSTPAAVAYAPLLTEPDDTLPERLGAYRLIREVGRGGMATVYLADDSKHGRQVAVKVMHSRVARLIGPDRFLREIEIAAGLSHPHILPLHDSGETRVENASGDAEPILFFVSPFVAGETLRDLLRREQRLPADDAVRLGREIALALDYAHRQGVVHLDIKPGNILLQEGHAVVADFGIARAITSVGGSVAHTDPEAAHGRHMGTPSYMSPEQWRGDPTIDARSDIFSLGCVLYEMVTGERPQGRDFAPLYEQVPRPLANVIVRAMAPSRADRFDSAGDLARALSDSSAPPPAPMGTLSRTTITMSIVAALALVGAASYAVARRDAATPGAPAVVPTKSIAVLPFMNMADKDEEYFSDGLSRDLIDLLQKSTDLRVTAPTSAFRFHEPDIDVRDVARQLGVAYLLRGHVKKIGERIRVITELDRAADGVAVWKATYDRTLDDIFALQDEIAEKTVNELKTTLLADALMADTRTRNPESYNLVLRGRYFMAQPTRENLERSVAYFQEALRHDSTNASAYAGLARAYRVQAGESWIPLTEGYQKSREAAQTAIRLDPQLAEGYEALAYVQSAYDWDWDAAEANYRRALELEPGNAEVLRSAALLMAKLGRLDEAIVGLRKAVDRDPFVTAYSALSYVLGAAGRWDEAESAARTALALGPNTVLRHYNLARALLFQGKQIAALQEVELEKAETWRLMGRAVVNYALGNMEESDKALNEYKAKFSSHTAMQIADIYAYRNELDSASAWLERAYAQHDPGIADIRNDPWLANFRSDPRYLAILQRMHLTR
jgi:serine/threonine-protein kinase